MPAASRSPNWALIRLIPIMPAQTRPKLRHFFAYLFISAPTKNTEARRFHRVRMDWKGCLLSLGLPQRGAGMRDWRSSALLDKPVFMNTVMIGSWRLL